MSLTSPRLIVPFIALALTALMVVSCGQQDLPTSPSRIGATTAQQSVVTEYFVTLVDDTPAPSGPGGLRLLDEDDDPPPPSGSAPAPWPPGPPPRAQPGVPVPTAPSTHPRLRIKVDPEMVPHDGKPVGIRSCRDNRFTWYYKQIIHTDTGVAVTISERENFFDGRYVNKNTETIQVGGNSTVTLNTRWCSAIPRPHYAQTRFKARDEYGEPVEISAPWVALLSP